MIRPSTIFWAVMVFAVGYGMFQVKYEVMQLEEQLTRTNQQIVDGRKALHVLHAEWSFLTQPARLDELAKRYLTLTPIGPAQLGRLDALPLRPAEGAATAAVPSASPQQGAAPPRPAPKPPAATSPAGTRIANAKVSNER